MKKRYIILFSVLLLFILSSNNIIGETNGNYVKVLNNNLNVREGPGTNYNIIAQVHANESYPYLDEVEEWVKIDLNGQEGWIASEFVEKIIANSNQNTDEELHIVTIEQSKVHIRKEPSTQSEIIRFAQEGEQLTVLGDMDKWLKVELDGETGFIYKSFIKLSPGTKGNVLKDKTIMVDPGHGGYDVGAISVSGHYEKDLTLTTSSLLKDTLETLGARVIMTRNSDEFIRLGSRVSLSNLINPDVFISLHYNSFPEAAYAKGISTYYYNENDRPLAESVQKHLLLSTNADDRNALYENLQVLRHNQSQAILLELGFISNHEEESLLKTKEYQLLLVEGIISGLNEYFTKKK